MHIQTVGITMHGTVGLAGCFGAGSTGTLAMQVTDQHGVIADFIPIAGMWLGPQEAEAGDAEAEDTVDRKYNADDEPQAADLVELQDENTQLVGERELGISTDEFLHLDTGGIDATHEDGRFAILDVAGEAPLTFNKQFRVREDSHTVFTADFTPWRDETHTTTERVALSLHEGHQIQQEDGWITILTTGESEHTTVSFQASTQVA